MQTDHYSIQKAVSFLSALPIALLLSSQSADALSTQDIRDLTYGQVKGSGIANRCPEATSSGKEQEIVLERGNRYKIVDMCLEPKSFQVEEEIELRKGQVRKGETSLFDPNLIILAT